MSDGFRISSVTIKETEDGGKIATAKIVGVGHEQATGLIAAIGSGVQIGAKDQRLAASLRSITFTAAKADGAQGTVSMKVVGPAELDEAMGKTVRVKALQMDLPETKP
jgi:hypothetical protein